MQCLCFADRAQEDDKQTGLGRTWQCPVLWIADERPDIAMSTRMTQTGSAWTCGPGHLVSVQVAHFQQGVGDLVGKALFATGDQNPLRIFGIECRSWHAMLTQRPRAACPVTILDRFVA
jgi:hypothetical protein